MTKEQYHLQFAKSIEIDGETIKIDDGVPFLTQRQLKIKNLTKKVRDKMGHDRIIVDITPSPNVMTLLADFIGRPPHWDEAT